MEAETPQELELLVESLVEVETEEDPAGPGALIQPLVGRLLKFNISQGLYETRGDSPHSNLNTTKPVSLTKPRELTALREGFGTLERGRPGRGAPQVRTPRSHLMGRAGQGEGV